MNYRAILKKLSPYKPGKSIEEIRKTYQIDTIVKLASNENPYGTSPKVLETIKNINAIEIYPDNYATELREKLAQKYNIEKEKFIFGNGSVEIIQMLCRVMLDKEDEVITCTPSFQSYYSETLLQDGTLIEIPLKNNCFDLDKILHSINKKTKMIFITNPNNPTGTIISEQQQREFLKQVPKDILVVLDEAYYEYVINKEYPDSVKMLDEFQNICILRTFSKAYGLAGMRVGYGIASEEIIQQLEKARVPFNISRISQQAALVALQDEKFMQTCVEQNKEVVEQLCKELIKANISYIPTETNFIMIQTKFPSGVAFEKLLRQGFIVRPVISNIENYVRVTIGTKEQMKNFMNALLKLQNENQ